MVRAADAMPAILELINPDGISYLAVAQHWAAGRFAYAINAYWSPFFSWAMVPWLLLGVPPVLAAKITLFLAAGVLVVGGWKLVGILSTDPIVRWPATAVLALLAFEWSLTVVTPDVIAVAIIVWYLLALDRLRRSESTRDAIVCGLLGALLYLDKAVGLPLFLAHFTLAVLRPATVRRWLVGVATFAMAIAPWVAAMAWKYGTLTMGTAGAHNWRLMGPETRRFEPFWGALFAPPNPLATSIWEDPSAVAMPDWSALGAPAHLLDLVVRHAWTLHQTLWARSPWVPIVVVVLVALVVAFRDPRVRQAALVRDALLAIGLVTAAALPFVVEERYVWTIPALAVVLAAYVVDRIGAAWPGAVATAMALVAASLVPPAIAGIQAQRAVADDMRRYALAASALPAELRGSRTATNPFSLENGGARWTSWNDGLYLSWHAGLRYFGVVPPRADAATIVNELERSEIETFVYVGPDSAPAYLGAFRQVASLPTMRARVFRRDR